MEFTKEFLSPDEIVEDIPKRLCKEDIDYFSNPEGKTDFVSIQMEITFKRWIRNYYKLWDKNNPLTLKDYKEELKDGVDYNPKHPDNISDIIYQKFLTKLKRVS